MTLLNQRPPRKCIFCGASRDITKEHIFAEWLQRYLPKEKKPRAHFSKDISGFDQHGNPIYKTFLGRLNRPGGFVKQKLRVVCARCNNGWMSALQSRTKPILIPLMKGDDCKIGQEQKVILSAWATMYAMVEDHIEPGMVMVPENDRRRFYGSHRPPNNWLIWLGRYEGERFNTHFYRNIVGEVENGSPPRVLSPDLLILTFVLGCAFFHVVNSTNQHKADFIAENYGPFLKLNLIWPDSGGAPADFNVPLQNVDVLLLRDSLKDLLRRRYERPNISE